MGPCRRKISTTKYEKRPDEFSKRTISGFEGHETAEPLECFLTNLRSISLLSIPAMMLQATICPAVHSNIRLITCLASMTV